MHITLIGMSNSGKSFWSKKLEEKGFFRLSSDDYIEEKLEKELNNLGYSGLADVSKWLGQPYEERHKINSKIYLGFETESLRTFIDQVQNEHADKNVVIDTTGSVIYTGAGILNQLKKFTKIIYLDTPSKVQHKMYLSYIKEPKPVLWGDNYYKLDGESDSDALKRCYPEFLRYRVSQYRLWADITLDYHLLRNDTFGIKNFMTLLQSKIQYIH